MKESLLVTILLSALCSGSLLAAPLVLTAEGLPDDTQYTIVNAGSAGRAITLNPNANTWITYSNGGNLSSAGINAGSNHIKLSRVTWTGAAAKDNVLRYDAGGGEIDTATYNSADFLCNPPIASAASTWFTHGRFKANTNGCFNNAGHLYISDKGHVWIEKGEVYTISNDITLGTSTYSEGNTYGGANFRIDTPTTFTGIMTIATPSKLTGSTDYTINQLGGAGNLSLSQYNYLHHVSIKNSPNYTGTLTSRSDIRVLFGDEENDISFGGTIVTAGGHFNPVGTGTKTVKNLTISTDVLGTASEGTLVISNTLDIAQASTSNFPITFGNNMTYVAPASGAFIAKGVTLPAGGSITIDVSRLIDLPMEEQRVVLATSDGVLDATTTFDVAPGFNASISGASVVVAKAGDASFSLTGDTHWSSLDWTDDATKTIDMIVPDTVLALTLTLDEPIATKSLSIKTSINTILTINTAAGYTGNAPASISTLLAQGTVNINVDLRTPMLIAGADLQIGANQVTTALTIPYSAAATISSGISIPAIAQNDGILYLKGLRDGINANDHPFFATCGLVVFNDESRKYVDFDNQTGITTRLRFDGTHVTNPDFAFRSADDSNAFNVTGHGFNKPTIEVVNAKVKSITCNIFGWQYDSTNGIIKLHGTKDKPAEIEFIPLDGMHNRFSGQFILAGTASVSSANPRFSFLQGGGIAKPSIVVEEDGIAELKISDNTNGKIGIKKGKTPTFEVKRNGTLTLSCSLSDAGDGSDFAFRKTGEGAMIVKKPSIGTKTYLLTAGKISLVEEGSLAGNIDVAASATLAINVATNTTTTPLRGGVSGVGNMIKSDMGTLILDQPSSFSGTIALNAGAIEATVPNALGSAKISLGEYTTLTMWKDTSDLARIQNVATDATIAVAAPTNLLSEATWVAGGAFTLTFALTNAQLQTTDPITIPLTNAPSSAYVDISVINSTTGRPTSSCTIVIENNAITITPSTEKDTVTYTPEDKPTNTFEWNVNTSFDNGKKFLDLVDVTFKSAVGRSTTVTVGEKINPGTLTLDAGYIFDGEPFSMAGTLTMASTANATEGPLQSSTITQTITAPLLDVSNGRLNLGEILTPEVVLGEGATLKANSLRTAPPPLLKAIRFIPLRKYGGAVEGRASVAELTLYRNDVALKWSDMGTISVTETGVGSGGDATPRNLINGVTANTDKWFFGIAAETPLAEGGVYATITFTTPIEMFDAYAVASSDVAINPSHNRGVTDWTIAISEDGVVFKEIDTQRLGDVGMFDQSWLGIVNAEGTPIASPTGSAYNPPSSSAAFQFKAPTASTSVTLSGKTSLVATGEYDVAIIGDGANPLTIIAEEGKVLTLSNSSTIESVPSYTFAFGNNYLYRGVAYDVIKWNNQAGLEAIRATSTIASQSTGWGEGTLAVDLTRNVLTVTWPEQILTWNGTATDLFAPTAWTIEGMNIPYTQGSTLLFPSCEEARPITVDNAVVATALTFEQGSKYAFSGGGSFTLATPFTVNGDVTFAMDLPNTDISVTAGSTLTLAKDATFTGKTFTVNGTLRIAANVTLEGCTLTLPNVIVENGYKLTIIPKGNLPTTTYDLNGGTLSLQVRTSSGNGMATVTGKGLIEIAPNHSDAQCPMDTTGFTGKVMLIDVPAGTGIGQRKLTSAGGLTFGDNTTFHIPEGPQFFVNNHFTIKQLFVEGTGSRNNEGFGALRIENTRTFTATTMTLTGDTSIGAGGTLNGAIVHALDKTPTLSLGSITHTVVGDMTVNATIGTIEKPIIIRGYLPAGVTKTITFNGNTFAEKVLSDGTTCHLVFVAGKHAVKTFEAAPTAKPIQIQSAATLSLALGKITFVGTIPTFSENVTLDLDGATFTEGATVIDWTGLTAPTIDFVPPAGAVYTFTKTVAGTGLTISLGTTVTGTVNETLKTFLIDNAPLDATSITIADEVAIQKLNLLGIKPIYTEGEAGVYTTTAPVYTFTIGSLDMSVVDIITATHVIKGVGEEVLTLIDPIGTFSLLYKTSLADDTWLSPPTSTVTTNGKSLSVTLTEGMNFFIIQVK